MIFSVIIYNYFLSFCKTQNMRAKVRRQRVLTTATSPGKKRYELPSLPAEKTVLLGRHQKWCQVKFDSKVEGTAVSD